MNHTLIWLLSSILVIGVILAALVWRRENGIAAACIFTVVSMLVVAGGFALGGASKTIDTEVWSGQVIEKTRVHDWYKRSYDCRCRTVTSGSGKNKKTSTKCDTCYEDRYTVKWACNTTIGRYTIDSLDTTSRSVYLTPDPVFYANIKKGDPVSKTSMYTNYIQAVPDSLFATSSAGTKEKFASLIRPYPDHIYNMYKVDRFVTPGYNFTDAAEWNTAISMGLRELGPRKQVNAIVVIAKTDDPSYEYALRDAWEGANKNDVVLIIGSKEFPKIDFVRVLSWTKNEMFKIELRDAVMEKGVIDQSIVPLMFQQIEKNFVRRNMSDFEFMKNDIDPPEWLIVTLMILVLSGAGFLWLKLPD